MSKEVVSAKETIEKVNEIFMTNLDRIVAEFRENETDSEFSYDIEEMETFGDFIDLMVENEKCEVWDTPYIAYLVINSPESIYHYCHF
jgi:hypothetical protein